MEEKYNISASKDNTLTVSNPATKFSAFCFEWSEIIVQSFIIVVLLMTFLFRNFTVDGQSMENTLLHGDKVAVIRWNYVPTNGDVVVIKRGEHFDKPIVKRIIATEGQSLKINFSDGSVVVNGEKLNETYIKERMWLKGDAKIPSVIPKGYCFVMGDNRNHSSDSRFNIIGLVPYENIIGKAKYVFFPFNHMKVIE